MWLYKFFIILFLKFNHFAPTVKTGGLEIRGGRQNINVHGMVYAAPMNENHEKAVWATGRSPLLVSCISWFKSIFTVNNEFPSMQHGVWEVLETDF